uniref:Uncharacterized protein n=1 Tax=Ananas comosus var. bracteatus TaxID=296719 RepID=A0A6V7P528_ANACO|nr:unnamed protein product [Ananas comosus var. bracteatus]
MGATVPRGAHRAVPKLARFGAGGYQVLAPPPPGLDLSFRLPLFPYPGAYETRHVLLEAGEPSSSSFSSGRAAASISEADNGTGSGGISKKQAKKEAKKAEKAQRQQSSAAQAAEAESSSALDDPCRPTTATWPWRRSSPRP